MFLLVFLCVFDFVFFDGTIRCLVEVGEIVIKLWNFELVQLVLIDLRLGDTFWVFYNYLVLLIDLRDGLLKGLIEEVMVMFEDGFVIHLGEFCFGRIEEWVELFYDVVARIEGKLSLGWLGLIVHAIVGFIDLGWKGTLMLELNNFMRVPIKLYLGNLIAQLLFMVLDKLVECLYGSQEFGSYY